MKIKHLFALLAVAVSAVLVSATADPLPILQFSPDGYYDIGKPADLRPNNVYINTQAVTQITSITTGVTINGTSGVITTVSAATAVRSKSTFTVTNSRVLAGSAVVACIDNYAG